MVPVPASALMCVCVLHNFKTQEHVIRDKLVFSSFHVANICTSFAVIRIYVLRVPGVKFQAIRHD